MDRDEVLAILQRRPVAEHILTVLREHQGEKLRFRNIKTEMMKHHWIHSDAGIVFGYNWLISVGLVKREGRFMWAVEDDGT